MDPLAADSSGSSDTEDDDPAPAKRQATAAKDAPIDLEALASNRSVLAIPDPHRNQPPQWDW